MGENGENKFPPRGETAGTGGEIGGPRGGGTREHIGKIRENGGGGGGRGTCACDVPQPMRVCICALLKPGLVYSQRLCVTMLPLSSACLVLSCQGW